MILRVGLIGAGAIADFHLRAYAGRPDVAVTAIADRIPVRRNLLAQEFSIKKQYGDYRAALDDADIDLVDITLPHDLHHRVTLDALQAGKDVILEKPIALTLEDADEMIEAAQSLGRRFFVVLNQRFVPVHRKARELLEQGVIGEPYRATVNLLCDEFARVNDPRNWKGSWDRGGGGVLLDSGTHLVDLMHYFFGDVRSVTALAQRLLVEPENKADDNTTAILEFKNGVMVDAHLSYTMVRVPNDERKIIYGPTGALVVDVLAEEPLLITRDNPPHRESFPVEHRPGWDWFGPFSMKRCLDHFVDCILEGKEPEVTPRDARRTLQTILAAYQSSREGVRVYL